MPGNSEIKWVAIILAAGTSSRMGQSKQLMRIKNETLISKTVRSANESDAREIVVVIRPGDHAIKNELGKFTIHLVENPESEKGMGSSLKSGLRYAMKQVSDLNAVIILVCDQPLLSSIHLKALIDEFKKGDHPIVASFYSGRNGVPAMFHKSMFEKLLSIDDEHGAKKIMEQNPALVKSIDFPNGVIDIDTPEDWGKLDTGR